MMIRVDSRFSEQDKQSAVEVMVELAQRVYERGEYREARDLYELTARSTHYAQAHYRLAQMYYRAEGCAQNLNLAGWHFWLAYRFGEAEGKRMFEECEQEVLTQQVKEENFWQLYEKLKLYRIAAQSGEPEPAVLNQSLIHFAENCLFIGNVQAAEICFCAAAVCGEDARAQYELAQLYEYDDFVGKAAALYWYDRAADGGVEGAADCYTRLLKSVTANSETYTVMDLADYLAEQCAAKKIHLRYASYKNLIIHDEQKAEHWKQIAENGFAGFAHASTLKGENAHDQADE